MKSKKVFDILVTCFIIALLGILGYQLINSNQLRLNKRELQNDKSKLNEKINYLENQIQDLIHQNEILNNQLYHQPEVPEDTSVCTFTRTFYYLSTLDYQQVPEEKWVILHAFEDRPFLLRIEKDFGTKFEKNTAYEITFTGRLADNDDNLNQYKIVAIRKTNKVGMAQVQEPCRVEEE